MSENNRCPVGVENAAKIDANAEKIDKMDNTIDAIFREIKSMREKALDVALARWPKAAVVTVGLLCGIIGALLGVALK